MQRKDQLRQKPPLLLWQGSEVDVTLRQEGNQFEGGGIRERRAITHAGTVRYKSLIVGMADFEIFFMEGKVVS